MKFGIVLFNCASLFLIMTIREDTREINSLVGPMGIVAGFTYLCASIFLNMFDSIAISILTSLCVDMDNNDGKPCHGPKKLHTMIDNIYKSLGLNINATTCYMDDQEKLSSFVPSTLGSLKASLFIPKHTKDSKMSNLDSERGSSFKK